LCLLLQITCHIGYAQRFNVDMFRAVDGLDTDFIKCVAQDTVGYIWIGTDDGLIKYDGNSFQKYLEATKSTYIKDFLLTTDNRLLVVHDLGLTEIFNSHDTTYFQDLIIGNRILTDTALWYPKSIFEDAIGNIWIAEPQSVVIFKNGAWQRFHFPKEYNSKSFVHSFSFAQINKDSLLITANPGQISLYDYAKDTIILIDDLRSEYEIFSLNVIDEELFVGTNKGLLSYDIHSKEKRVIIPENVFSDIQPYKNQGIIATTESRVNYYLVPGKKGWDFEEIPKTGALTNQVFIAKDNSIWLSTEKGLKILSEKYFSQLDLKDNYQFIEAIISKNEHPYIYALSKDNITIFDKSTETIVSGIEGQEEYFLSGAVIEDNLWISSTSEILRLNDGMIDRRISLADYGRYVFDVHADSKNMLWIAQEASIGVKKLNPYSLSIEVYDSLNGLKAVVTAITSTHKGTYVATANPNELIAFKANGDNNFQIISHNISKEYNSGLVVSDLVVIDDRIWIGTNYGLFCQQNEDLIHIDFDSKFGEGMIRSMTFDGQNIWLGNSMGLFSINPKTLDFSHYDEKSGLPINTINDEGILVNNNKVWVGTSQGVSVMSLDEKDHAETIKPFIIDMKINGDYSKFDGTSENELPFNSFLGISFSSMTFPSSQVYYSFRIDNNKWSRSDNLNYAEFSNLKAGSHLFEFRAKKTGNYNWSEVAEFTFKVSQPFYFKKVFIVITLVLITFLISLTREITRLYEQKRTKVLKQLVRDRTSELNEYKKSLEQLVGERTAELEAANEEIKETQNQLIQTEKMASLGVLTAGIAHEINNPVNYVQGGLYSISAILEDSNVKGEGLIRSKKEMSDVLHNMQIGVDRITRIVSSLSRFSRKDGNQMTPCNIQSILESCLLILNHEITENINIVKDYGPNESIILADEGKIHQLFVNLLSNAVHAVDKEGQIKIKVTSLKDSINIRISDNGIGISDENMRKIYDPFFTTKPPGKGTGLGLFITHKVVEDHGGKIKFKSILRKGTSVFVKFKTNQLIQS